MNFALVTPDRGLRHDMLAGIPRSRLTAICRTPPVWPPRETVVSSLRMAARVYNGSERWFLDRLQCAAEKVGLTDWQNAPSLDTRVEKLHDNFSRAFSLLRVLVVPYRAVVIDNVLHGQEGVRRSLLERILASIYEESFESRIFLADTPANLPAGIDMELISGLPDRRTS
jgi:hypothetical protein